MSRTLKPTLAKRLSTAAAAARDSICARPPVASATVRPSATTRAAAPNVTIGDRPAPWAACNFEDPGGACEARLGLAGLGDLLVRDGALLPVPRTTAGIRVLRNPQHQIVEPETQMR